MNEPYPRWPLLVCGVFAAVSAGTCLALGYRLDWAILTTTAFSGLVVAWVALREQEPPRPQPEDVDEEFVRRLEALAARMREELEARRATPAA
jgi:hypothetical protein